MLSTIFTIIAVIIIILGILWCLALVGGLNVLSFLGRILTSPVFWVLAGIVVVIAYWRHENP